MGLQHRAPRTVTLRFFHICCFLAVFCAFLHAENVDSRIGASFQQNMSYFPEFDIFIELACAFLHSECLDRGNCDNFLQNMLYLCQHQFPAKCVVPLHFVVLTPSHIRKWWVEQLPGPMPILCLITSKATWKSAPEP